MNGDIFSSVQGQVVMSGVIVWVMQWLKDSKRFPFLDRGTDTLNRIVGVAAASITGAGFAIAHTGNLFEGGQIVIAYPSFAQFAEWVVHTSFGYMTQQGIYHGYAKPKEAAELVVGKAAHIPAPPVQYAPKPTAVTAADRF